MRFRSAFVIAATSLLTALVACTSTSVSGGTPAGSGGSCPCTLGNSGIHATIGCGESACESLNGKVTGYRCTEKGAVEDMTACAAGSSATSPGADAGTCVGLTCGADGGAECGSGDNGCGVMLACAACSGGSKCSDARRCLSPAQSIIVYGDYEGGTFVIDVDQDLPDLAIGLVSYQPMHVSITGAHASRIVAVTTPATSRARP